MNLPALTTIPVVDPGAADGVFALLWLVIGVVGAVVLARHRRDAFVDADDIPAAEGEVVA